MVAEIRNRQISDIFKSGQEDLLIYWEQKEASRMTQRMEVPLTEKGKT